MVVGGVVSWVLDDGTMDDDDDDAPSDNDDDAPPLPAWALEALFRLKSK